ncbi:MAG: cobalamin-dependent protein [Eubacterium sp.]|jgi:methanogenic corrinoid protein MtbC1|nr:cobalamin-dependent protein [Eubacterium sp.]
MNNTSDLLLNNDLNEKLKALRNAMGDLNDQSIRALTKEILKADPGKVREMINAMNDGMMIVGQRFDTYEYFVGDLIYAGDIYSEMLSKLKPFLTKENDPSRRAKKPVGKVILCTVEGDLHDIGKNIVKYVLESRGLEVIDLGVNVSASEIVNRTMLEGASVVALSAVLTIAVESMEKTIQSFSDAGIRNRVKIIIGGTCTSQEVARKIHADAYGGTPEETAVRCLQWVLAKNSSSSGHSAD